MDTWLQAAARVSTWTYWLLVMGMVVGEWVFPSRRPSVSLPVRWSNNVAVALLNGFLIRWTFPLAGIGWALVCQERGWGIFNRWSVPIWVELAVAVLVYDVAHYLLHRSFHASEWLWRVHRTHHTDQDYDFTTGVRFHPIEAAMAITLVVGVTTVLGASPLAVLVADLVGMASTFIEHANLRVPAALERRLRAVLVTPGMHRIHHLQSTGDSRTNFATTFSFWDRLFQTYRAEPSEGCGHMVFGVAEFADPKHLRLHWMLAQPFLNPSSDVVPIPVPPADVRESAIARQRSSWEVT